MSYLINNEQKINDIVFASRNKNYGAYAIRSSYGNTLVKSISIMAFGFISLMGSAYYYTNKDNKPNQKTDGIIFKDSILVTPFDFKKVEEIEQPKQPENQQKQKTRNPWRCLPPCCATRLATSPVSIRVSICN